MRLPRNSRNSCQKTYGTAHAARRRTIPEEQSRRQELVARLLTARPDLLVDWAVDSPQRLRALVGACGQAEGTFDAASLFLKELRKELSTMPLSDEESRQLEALLKKKAEVPAPAHEEVPAGETTVSAKDGDIKIKGPYEDLIQTLIDLVMKGIHAIDHCRNEKDSTQTALANSITVSELKWKYVDLLKQHGWPPFPNGPKEKTDATNTVDRDLVKAQQLVKDAQAASAKGDDKTAKEKLDQLKNVLAEIAVNLALLK